MLLRPDIPEFLQSSLRDIVVPSLASDIFAAVIVWIHAQTLRNADFLNTNQ